MMQAAMAVVLTSGNVSPDDPITIETTAVAELRLV
jgi:MOSC domain-containing protein YiiM